MGNVFPEKEKGIPSPVFTPGRSHGQRSLVDYGPWGHKESDTTEQLSTSPRSDEDVCARTAPWKRILLNMEHEIGCVFNLPQMYSLRCRPLVARSQWARLFSAEPGGTKIKDSDAPDQHRLQD